MSEDFIHPELTKSREISAQKKTATADDYWNPDTLHEMIRVAALCEFYAGGPALWRRSLGRRLAIHTPAHRRAILDACVARITEQRKAAAPEIKRRDAELTLAGMVRLGDDFYTADDAIAANKHPSRAACKASRATAKRHLRETEGVVVPSTALPPIPILDSDNPDDSREISRRMAGGAV